MKIFCDILLVFGLIYSHSVTTPGLKSNYSVDNNKQILALKHELRKRNSTLLVQILLISRRANISGSEPAVPNRIDGALQAVEERGRGRRDEARQRVGVNGEIL